jgi:hypothetical protein
MQWAKLPSATMNMSIQMIMTEPVMECELETSQSFGPLAQTAAAEDA